MHIPKRKPSSMRLRLPAPATTGGPLSRTVTTLRAGRSSWPAELVCARLWYEPHLERLHEDVITRRADLIQLEQIASGYPSRERDQRPVRGAAARRGLSDPFDHPFRQRSGVDLRGIKMDRAVLRAADFTGLAGGALRSRGSVPSASERGH
jgi:hypothetical protein